MKFNPTPLECVLFTFVCLAIYIGTKHGRLIRRWLKDYFRQRRGPRNLKPKSPEDCPACNRDCSLLPVLCNYFIQAVNRSFSLLSPIHNRL